MSRKPFLCLSLTLLAMGIPSLTSGFASKLKSVALQVTVEPVDSDGMPCNIRGDSTGNVYTNGLDGVSASLDASGFLVIDFQTGRQPERFVTFDFGTPDPTDSCPWPCGSEVPFVNPTAVGGVSLTTIPAPNSPTYTPLQNLTLNSNEVVELAWMFPWYGVDWRASFHRGLADYVGSPASYAVVTCTGSNSAGACSKWRVEPSVASATSSPVALLVKAVTSRGSTTLYPEGFYYIPFNLTLKALP